LKKRRNSIHFVDSPDLKTSNNEEAERCEDSLTIKRECGDALSKFQNKKTHGSDGFTIDFYRLFWEVIGHIMVDSFNFARISARSFIHLPTARNYFLDPLQKNKDVEYLKNWRSISFLNNDYKIATSAISVRMVNVLPKIIHSSQTGYVKGRYIGESIRTITDIMSFTETQNIPIFAVFLDFEKAFDYIEWNYLQKCLKTFNFGPQLRQWINVVYSDISSCILNNGLATKQFNLGREVRQGGPLSGILLTIGIEILANAIRSTNDIKGIEIDDTNTIKLTQYADDNTVFLRDVQSLNNLFNLLAQFEKLFWITNKSIKIRVAVVRIIAISKRYTFKSKTK